jgi:glycine/D-amino acid oxidase-like deaminating enzyme
MHVLICGGGVIGASIAYFLSCRGVKATVIEGTGLACAASGKSGGFLALDWSDGSPLAPLARRSFALHAELAEEIAEDWGYRRLDTYGGFAGFRRRRSAYDLGWLSDDVTVAQALGSPETTAQVHPGQFTAALMRAAEAQGAELRLGQVTGITQYESRATGVEVGGNVVEGDAIVIAMGPWSILAAWWLPLPGGVRLEGPQPRFRHRRKNPGGGCVPRISGTERCGADPRAVSPHRRHNVCLRNLQRGALAG